MKTILLALDPATIPQQVHAQLKEITKSYELLISKDEKTITDSKDSIVASLGWSPPDYLLDSPILEWIQLWSAGADWVVRQPDIHDRTFKVTTTAGIHGVGITEHIIGLILSFARDIHRSIRAQQKHEWIKQEDHTTFEAAGRTMVLIGIGGIGRRTAEISAAMGMHIIGVRTHPEKSAVGVSEMYGPADLEDVLPKADFVVNTLPITPASENMFGETEFRAMKNSALYINVGRGKTVDEKAMIRALKNGWIAGAGLDVTAEEPLPESSELWDMENVIITSHYSGSTAYSSGRIWEFVIDNLTRFVSGKELLNIVDKRRGY